MTKEKFDTLIMLLTEAFRNMDAGHQEQHVTIVSPNGYNLSINMVAKSRYPEIERNSEKMECSEIHFIRYIPYEFGFDLNAKELVMLFNHLKTSRSCNAISQVKDKDAIFLFTDKEILLFMKEEFDNTGIN